MRQHLAESSASTIFSVAAVSNGSTSMRGRCWLHSAHVSGAGILSAVPALTRSTTSMTGALTACATLVMPDPRTSSRPASRGGGVATSTLPTGVRTTWSSATSRHPAAIRRRARSDFPAPESPRNRAPAPDLATQVAWQIVMVEAWRHRAIVSIVPADTLRPHDPGRAGQSYAADTLAGSVSSANSASAVSEPRSCSHMLSLRSRREILAKAFR